MIEIDELIALETKVWVALQAGDQAADMDALADDFLGVYPSGFSDRADHVGQLDRGPTVSEFVLFDARILTLSDCDAVLAYRAEFRRPGSETEWETMFVSSVWSKRDDRWVNVFSQDTPAEQQGTLPG